MKLNDQTTNHLALAIAAVLGTASIGIAPYSAAAAASDGSSDQLQTIMVTAQRRVQNSQNVPITLQALTSRTLAQLNITTIDDALKYLPNVTSASEGPAQSNLYMRGLSTGTIGSGAEGSFPTVAIYLDDQSGQLPGRNLDVYAADLQRIEVLEGPQGTLFGAGAQAGVVRYITNKPVLDRTEGDVNAGYAVTAHGDPSTNIDATLNVPIIPGRFAVRALIFNENRGGYIDNIPATFTRAPTDKGIAYYFHGVVPPGPSLSNDNLVGRAINPVTYKGGRVEAKYQFDPDWSALASQMVQNTDAKGVFYAEQYDGLGKPLPPLSAHSKLAELESAYVSHTLTVVIHDALPASALTARPSAIALCRARALLLEPFPTCESLQQQRLERFQPLSVAAQHLASLAVIIRRTQARDEFRLLPLERLDLFRKARKLTLLVVAEPHFGGSCAG